MLLCDYAEEVNGKLYIMGASWTRIVLVRPASMALAIQILVPWDETNEVHKLATYLTTQDGESVTGPDGLPIRVEARMEVGRPPGMLKGEAVSAPLALKFEGLMLEAGAYTWKFDIDDVPSARTSFVVIRGGEPQKE